MDGQDHSCADEVQDVGVLGIVHSRELEHLLTLSLVYQVLIGFIPLSFFSPIDRVWASVSCNLVICENDLLWAFPVASLDRKSSGNCRNVTMD